MRLVFLILLNLFLQIAVYSQTILKYYDYNWKETSAPYARFFSKIVKTDSGWHRSDYFLHEHNNLQMDGTYLDSACKIQNGIFYYFHPNKTLESVGHYVKGKKQGLWLSFHPNGMISDSTFYENDKISGISESWYSNGYQKDSVTVNSGIKTWISYFDNGAISEAGRYDSTNNPIGRWKFFYPNGNLSALETFNNGKLIERIYYDTVGKLMDTTYHDRPSSFPGGDKGWLKYLENKLIFPEQYEIVNSDRAAVVVEFTVNESGKTEDVNIITPFYEVFNKIVIDAIRKCPKWQPAISHNRFVKNRQRQVVNFNQVED